MRNPKSILITGASSGIGAELAKAYAESGIVLSLCGRNQNRLAVVAEQCKALGAMVKTAAIDVRHAEELRKWIEQQDSIAPLDLVIANAGISNAGKERSEQFDRIILEINLFGVFNTIYPAIDLMRKRSYGQIAIVGSLAGMYGFPRSPVYSASKSAVRTLGESLRNKLAPSGIEISVILPGFIKTPLTDINEYRMPFLMSVEKTVKIIKQGLAKNKGLIAFPLRLYCILWFLRALPHRLAQKVAAKIK